MKRRRSFILALGLVVLASCPLPARAAVTSDLVLSLRYWETDSEEGTRLGNVRLLADADLGRALSIHLDLEREAPEDAQFREAYGEWGRPRPGGTLRVRVGRFQVPFGIYNRSELYYVGLLLDPIVKYYPFRGPQLGRTEQGIVLLYASGVWQVEAALFGDGGGGGAFLPDGGEGSVRVQRSMGPLIVGVNALRGHIRDPGTGFQKTTRFFGLDFRFSRPTLILRGELTTGSVPGGTPRGFYLDALYHPVSLHRVTFVGRTEAARGQPVSPIRYRRHTIGVKWDLGGGTAMAVNQAFETPRTPFGSHGTTIYLWHMRRL